MTDEILHIGTKRHSGRYPWGSGNDPYQNSMNFLGYVAGLKAQGLSDAEIANAAGMAISEFRDRRSIANAAKRQADAAFALRLKEKNYSNVAIGERMGINESSVRSLLNPALTEKSLVIQNTADMLKKSIDTEGGYIDVGVGSERHMNLSAEKLRAATRLLEEQGYQVITFDQPQLGTGEMTRMKVLAPPGTEWVEVVNNRQAVRMAGHRAPEGDGEYFKIGPPVALDPKRLSVRWDEEGGTKMDGVIEVRRGVDDISLGKANYAQVRIQVGPDRYLKGMAMYADDLPDGVDVRFNTNKARNDNKLSALKKLTDDEDLPFGSVVSPKYYVDKNGNQQKSVHNIVYEEGDWDRWSKSLSSQMLSKQTPQLIKDRLGEANKRKQAELDEILALTNPAVRKRLLDAFADEADSAAVDLKGAPLGRQANKVILPFNSVKDNEIYAPSFRQGESVVLIRHPHGGIFEIPDLVVNNNNPTAKRIIGDAIDAVGINHKVAEQLSGADFDGDSVVVIPNNPVGGRKPVKTQPTLQGLKDFDPKRAYPAYEGMPPMKTKQREMGNISNLITDMTIRGANNTEIAAAVRHSMVVIDAEKHNLNYKQSAIDNGIPALKAKYQKHEGSTGRGAATVISRASSRADVLDRKPRPAAEGGPIDKATGKRVYVPTGKTVVTKSGKTVASTIRSTQMAETSDAFTLSSGTAREAAYASHANRLKGIANEARRQSVNTPLISYSPSANRAYAKEAASLKNKLDAALKNAPLERQAQIVAGARVNALKKANPNWENDKIRKIKGAELQNARLRVGAKKQQIEISDREWAAIQAGAISNNALTKVLQNSNMDRVKELATPRAKTLMEGGKVARAKQMAARGSTQSEIADALGVSVATLNRSL